MLESGVVFRMVGGSCAIANLSRQCQLCRTKRLSKVCVKWRDAQLGLADLTFIAPNYVTQQNQLSHSYNDYNLCDCGCFLRGWNIKPRFLAQICSLFLA